MPSRRAHAVVVCASVRAVMKGAVVTLGLAVAVAGGCVIAVHYDQVRSREVGRSSSLWVDVRKRDGGRHS